MLSKSERYQKHDEWKKTINYHTVAHCCGNCHHFQVYWEARDSGRCMHPSAPKNAGRDVGVIGTCRNHSPKK